MRVRNSLNYDFTHEVGEINREPSLTVPDQALSVAQILDRHARGLPLGASLRVPMFDEDDDLPDIRTLDLAERQELVIQYKQEVEDIRKADIKRKEDFAKYRLSAAEKRASEEAAKRAAPDNGSAKVTEPKD